MVVLIIPSLLVASLSYELIEVRFTNWLKTRKPVIFKMNQPALK
jgi:peptidoglycan/LPS O-acetylase OafA/YrhL